MLLILEITLTIAAWRNGWGVRALLPLAGAFVAAFLGGAMIGASSGSIEDARVLGFLCDLGAVIVLGVMSRKSPAPERTTITLARSEDPVRLSGSSTVSGD